MTKRQIFSLTISMMVSVLATGCETYKFSLDHAAPPPANFNAPTVRKNVVLLYEHQGNDPIGMGLFLQTLKDTGAFSEVAGIDNEKRLKKYPGWDVLHVNMTCSGSHFVGLTGAYANYDVKFRFENGSNNESARDSDYHFIVWHTAYGTPLPDSVAAAPGETSQTATLGIMTSMAAEHKGAKEFAKDLVSMALSEAQRTGHFLQ